MSSRLRTACFAGLLVGCAAVLGVGCSDDTTKKVNPGNEAGEGGEVGQTAGGSAGTAGSTVNPEGGVAGEPVGAGGTDVIGGAGAPAEAAGAGGEDTAAAGAGPVGLVCSVSGGVTNLTLSEMPSKTVCRGATISHDYLANATGSLFTCCGALGFGGIGNNAQAISIAGEVFDGNVNLTYTVPTDASFGQQTISVTCSEGDIGSIAIDVSDSLTVPVVTDAPSSIAPQDQVTISGSHLSGTTVKAVATDGSGTLSDCVIDPETSTDSQITCSFGGDIELGQYAFVVTQDGCGDNVSPPTFVVMQSL